MTLQRYELFLILARNILSFFLAIPLSPLHSTKIRIFFKPPNFILKLLFGSFNTAHVAIKCSFNSSSTHYTH